ncbi:hypothetical protein [Mesorhizobium sp. M1A.F.Ca.ET.072.01.1.1]|uniref:HoxN/HupN/NixA family nickel/cobalt transporter n=1 Tax=Mesorhizobium sp. M1A.F.Ca.ET.072.01.1.1 TaxID=2496753 RepID=UPI001FDFB477|nr:hypothetical protein [Mesorhizobium sp. M1A.F.Ca.ET.072.01.1.1]
MGEHLIRRCSARPICSAFDDADHIAAIDNIVRKLTHEGKHPFSVGFFFLLGAASSLWVTWSSQPPGTSFTSPTTLVASSAHRFLHCSCW